MTLAFVVAIVMAVAVAVAMAMAIVMAAVDSSRAVAGVVFVVSVMPLVAVPTSGCGLWRFVREEHFSGR